MSTGQVNCPPRLLGIGFGSGRGTAALLLSSEEYYGVELVSRVMGSGSNQFGALWISFSVNTYTCLFWESCVFIP